MAKNGHLVVKYKNENPVMIRIGHAGVMPATIKKIVESEEFQKKLESRHKHKKQIIGELS